MEVGSWLNGSLIGSLITICIKFFIDNHRLEKIRKEEINKYRLHKAYSPLYLYASLNLEYSEDILRLLEEIKKGINDNQPIQDVYKNKIKFITHNQEKLAFYNEKIIKILSEFFGYVHAEDELSIVQYLTLSEKILRRDWCNPISVVKVDAMHTCFEAICYLLNIIKSRTHLSTCEIKNNLDLISLHSALETLTPTINDYLNKQNKYDVSKSNN